MTETWSYYSATVIQIVGDLTAKYRAGQLIKIVQSGSTKFFIITAVALASGNTRLTVSGGGVYTLGIEAITFHGMQDVVISGLPFAFDQITRYIETLHAATSKSTPVDTDELGLYDGIFKKLTWANLKTTLGAIYAPIAKGVTNGDSHDHVGGDGAQINHGNLSNVGTNAHTTIDNHLASTSNPHSTTASQVGAAPSNKGVTNGDSHDHVGGDGAQIDHGSQGGLGDDDHTGYFKVSGRAGEALYVNGADIWLSAGFSLKCTDGNHRITFDQANNVLDIIEYGSIYLSPGATSGVRTNTVYFTGGGNLWLAANCSALTFTDRTEAFIGNALEVIKKIKATEKGEIDHATLPEFVINPYQDAEGEWWPGRNIGNMVSVLTTGMQELLVELEKRDVRITQLEERLAAIENKVGGA
jgi:hypothetical protein